MARNNIRANPPPRRSSRPNLGLGGTVSNLAWFSAVIESASVKPRQSQAFKHPQSQVPEVTGAAHAGLGTAPLSDANTANSQAIIPGEMPRQKVLPKARPVPRRRIIRKANLDVYPIPEESQDGYDKGSPGAAPPAKPYQLPAQPKPRMVTMMNTRYVRALPLAPGTIEQDASAGPTSGTASFAAPPGYRAVSRAAVTPPASGTGSVSNPLDSTIPTVLPYNTTLALFSDTASRKRTRPTAWSDGPSSDIETYSNIEKSGDDDIVSIRDDDDIVSVRDDDDDADSRSAITEFDAPHTVAGSTRVRDNIEADVALTAIREKGKASERSVLHLHWGKNGAPRPPHSPLPLTQYPGAGADRIGALITQTVNSSARNKRTRRNTAVKPAKHTAGPKQLRYYDWRWQRVLEYAKLCFRREIVSYYTFPDIKLSKSLASESIMEALVEYNHNSHPDDVDTDDEYQPHNAEDNRIDPALVTDDMIELVHLDKSTFRGEIKTFVINSMRGSDPLGLALSEEAVTTISKTEYKNTIRKKIKMMLNEYSYLHGTAPNGSQLNYGHDFLRTMCIKYFYGEENHVGQMFPAQFESLPLEAVALMACVIRNMLESLIAKMNGNGTISFHAATYKASYNKHVDLLKDLDMDSIDGAILRRMLNEWANRGRLLSINGNDNAPSEDRENPVEDSYGVISQHHYSNPQVTRNADAGPSHYEMH